MTAVQRSGAELHSAKDELAEALFGLQKAIDTRDWDTVRATFADDGSGYGATGLEDTIAKMRAHLDGVGPTQHLIGNLRVEFTEGGARTLAYARVHHVGAGPMAGSFFECMGEYDDRWVSTTDGWRLALRTFDMQITLGDFAVLRGSDD
ncbi:nuclear transport factor 2 family protein [Nocardioides sp. Root151]|uniref:nuclear transport factor 2 family protein n=1 Tax=Nocardioides sp. Root151 TaxID=1736475 RepID=UPI0007034913|nr:nuclear transport factor 2 family protein [Nocardioides sp. Root151]KQZ74948.1 hypothetical protein ASD66_00750 [Nocardioides sp. Root151]